MPRSIHPPPKTSNGENKIDLDLINFSQERSFVTKPLVGTTLFDKRIWLDAGEAADYLRITVNALRIRIWRKQVIAHKFGNRLRFKRVDLDKYMRLYR